MSQVRLSWRKTYDPEVLVARLESERVSTKGTHVSAERFPGVGFSPLIDRTLQVVGSAIAWPQGLDPETRHEILFHAMASVAIKGAITPDALLKACAAETQARGKRTWQECVVVSSISVHPRVPLRACTLEKARVKFHGELNAKWDRSSFQRQIEHVFLKAAQTSALGACTCHSCAYMGVMSTSACLCGVGRRDDGLCDT